MRQNKQKCKSSSYPLDSLELKIVLPLCNILLANEIGPMGIYPKF